MEPVASWPSISLIGEQCFSFHLQVRISYTVKKTRWQSGGNCEINITSDPSLKASTFKNSGKVTEIRVPPGQPKDSQPNNKSLFEVSKGSRKVAPNQIAPTQKAVPSIINQVQAVSLQTLNNGHKITSSSTTGLSSHAAGSSLTKGPTYGSNSGLKTQSMGNVSANISSSNTSLSASQQNLAAAAAAKKRPPPPPAKKIARCEAIYVMFFSLSYFL